MSEADAAPLVVDVALVAILAEALFLGWRQSSGARGLTLRHLAANLAAGLFLMLGLRAVLAGAAWPWLAGALAAAGLAHLIDLKARANGL